MGLLYPRREQRGSLLFYQKSGVHTAPEFQKPDQKYIIFQKTF